VLRDYLSRAAFSLKRTNGKKGKSFMAEGKRKRRASSKEFSKTRGILWLWAGLLTAPLAFLLHLQINYMLTTQLCPDGRKLVLHLVTFAFLLVAAVGGFIAWLNWESTGRRWPGEQANVPDRSRFMAVVGLLISALIVLAFIAQLIPQFIFDPCNR
jgi:TRAP-type C4-dicarboxylate transport system permease small subunit